MTARADTVAHYQRVLTEARVTCAGVVLPTDDQLRASPQVQDLRALLTTCRALREAQTREIAQLTAALREIAGESTVDGTERDELVSIIQRICARALGHKVQP